MIRFDKIAKEYYNDDSLIVLLKARGSFIALEKDAILVSSFLGTEDLRLTNGESIVVYFVFSENFIKSLIVEFQRNKLSYVILRNNKVERLKRFNQSHNKIKLNDIKIRDLINEMNTRKFDLKNKRNSGSIAASDQLSHYEKIYQVKNKLSQSEFDEIDLLLSDNTSCANCIEHVNNNCNKGFNETNDCFVSRYRLAPGETDNWPRGMEFNRMSKSIDYD